MTKTSTFAKKLTPFRCDGVSAIGDSCKTIGKQYTFERFRMPEGTGKSKILPFAEDSYRFSPSGIEPMPVRSLLSQTPSPGHLDRRAAGKRSGCLAAATATPYDACDEKATWVNSLSLVRHPGGNDYSVPTAYSHREVRVRGWALILPMQVPAER